MIAFDNKAIIRRYYEELWNQWNLALVDQIISSRIDFRGSLGNTIQGREEFKHYVEMVRNAFPDFHNAVEELIAEGSRVAARLTYTGTHSADLFGAPPTWRKVRYEGIAIFRLERGMVEAGWVLGDVVSLRRQIGAPLDS